MSFNKTFCALLCLLMTASADAWALGRDLANNGRRTTLVIYDRSTGKLERGDRGLSERRLPPCSTFKIYNTLIGFELGLLPDPDAPWYRWDGVRRPMEAWNQDLSLRQAFKVSAVPAFQALAVRIGEERMRKFVELIGYGTRDMSAGIDRFWLDDPDKTPIRISAEEQVMLLNKLLDGQLPFDARHVATLKDMMMLVETDKGTLYGKTGSAMGADGKWTLGWFVGFVQSSGVTRVFACNMTGGDGPSGLTARAWVEQHFRSKGGL